MADDKPIIIIKKKGGHGGHHGGAWKIAYADFVTAMMAFFMVMWLVNTADSPTKKAIASYFRRPGIFEQGSGSPVSTGGAGIMDDAFVPARPEENRYTFGKSQDPRQGKNQSDGGDQEKLRAAKTEEGQGFVKGIKTTGDSVDSSVDKIIEPVANATERKTGDQEMQDEIRMASQAIAMQNLADQIKAEIESNAELRDLLGMVDVKVDADGLNIEIMDTDRTSMFRKGSAAILPEAQAAFQKLAGLLSKQKNSIDIVGHTDGTPFLSRNRGYSNWELSSDRANAARRLLESEGIPPERITSVMGRADKDLKLTTEPAAAANRRITLKMRFVVPQTTINLNENPEALNQFKQKEQVFQKDFAEREKVHSLTIQEVLKERAKSEKKGIQLPTIAPPTNNPDYIQKDKIFGDSPVVGPKDAFVP